MPKLDVTFEFDFPVNGRSTSPSHQIEIDLDDPTYQELNGYMQHRDLTTEDGLRTALYFVDDWIQYELITSQLKYSNYVVDTTKGLLKFDVDLTIGDTSFHGNDIIEIDDPDTIDDLDASPVDDLKDYVEDIYSESHHYFDILDIKAVYTP